MSDALESANSFVSRFAPRLPVILLLFLSFATYSAVRAPVPGVNEPHYLTKAKHYWNPQWCADDLFLQSTNTHLVFYQTVGVLTKWLTLEQTAWVARVIVLLLLAFGWDSLMQQLFPRRWMSLWSAWCFLFFSAVGNFSGEWVVGGVESKGFAYAFLFFTLAAWMKREYLWAGACAGLAMSFHPVVGCWSLFAGLFALAINGYLTRGTTETNTVPLATHFLSLGLLVLCSLPGIVPAIQMLSSVPQEVSVVANDIQVYFRLKHHLDPMVFSPLAYSVYGVMTIFFAGAAWGFKKIDPLREKEHRLFFWYVMGAFLIAVAGIVISYRTGTPQEMWQKDFRTFLLKFYTSRLFDVMLLVAVSVTLVRFAGWLISQHTTNSKQTENGRQTQRLLVWLLFAGGMLGSVLLPSVDARPRRLQLIHEYDQLDAWREACHWIKTKTPKNAIVFTPRTNWAFRWFAERTDYVAYKDCPQDALSIIEWKKRFYDMRRWRKRAMKDNLVTKKELKELQSSTGISFLLESYQTKEKLGDIAAKPVFENQYYRVYAIEK